MRTTQIPRTDSAIWGRHLGPTGGILSPEAAHAILQIDFPQEDKDHMRALAAKAREGALTPEEQEETRSYERVGNLLALLKSKARQCLKRASSNGGWVLLRLALIAESFFPLASS
jgi:hypothetical protein